MLHVLDINPFRIYIFVASIFPSSPAKGHYGQHYVECERIFLVKWKYALNPYVETKIGTMKPFRTFFFLSLTDKFQKQYELYGASIDQASSNLIFMDNSGKSWKFERHGVIVCTPDSYTKDPGFDCWNKDWVRDFAVFLLPSRTTPRIEHNSFKVNSKQ
jgi:hypothetical protein